MNISKIGESDYLIYINGKYLEKEAVLTKEDIGNLVKEKLYKLKDKLFLKGFYKVIVFLNQKIGMFLEILKLEDTSIYKSLDLRIIINEDAVFYYKTLDFFLIKDCNSLRYFDGYFYCLVDDKFDELLEKVEFGNFIYGDKVIIMLKKGIVL